MFVIYKIQYEKYIFTLLFVIHYNYDNLTSDKNHSKCLGTRNQVTGKYFYFKIRY